MISKEEFFKKEAIKNPDFMNLSPARKNACYQKHLTELKGLPEDPFALARGDREARENHRRKQAVAEKRKRETSERKKTTLRSEISKLDPLTSAKIAKAVINNFESEGITDLIDFFPSSTQLYQVVTEHHRKLEPIYRRELCKWFSENTNISARQIKSSDEITNVIAICMKQGLSALCKSPTFKERLGDYGVTEESNLAQSGPVGISIEKHRSWSEISSSDDEQV